MGCPRIRSVKGHHETDRGFTLVELMIAVAILAIVSAIAIPAYNGYIRESRLGALRMNLETLRIAVEGFRLDSRTDTFRDINQAPPYATASIASVYGWIPEGDGSRYQYLVYAANSTVFGIQAAEGNTGWVRFDKNRSTGTAAWCDNTQSGCPTSSEQ